MEYKILETACKDALAKEVNALIADGWAVQGGVSISVNYYGGRYYAQAMVRQA